MGKRVDWTDFEQSQVYAGTVDLLKSRKVPLPVEPPGKAFLQAIRDAQIALPENRRRPLASIDAVTGPLAKRFVDNGIIRKDYMDSYRRGWDKKQRRAENESEAQAPDPRDVRIQELEESLSTIEKYVQDVERHRKQLEEELAVARAQPGPMEFIQKWVAHTLALALQEAEDAKKPAFIKVPPSAAAPVPDFERDRRKDPTPRPSGSVDPRPKIAVVAEFNNDAEITNIHEQVKNVAQMRYLNSISKLDHLNNFALTGGKVIVWTDRLPHSWKAKIEHQGVRYQYCNGTPNAVISCIRKAVGAE